MTSKPSVWKVFQTIITVIITLIKNNYQIKKAKKGCNEYRVLIGAGSKVGESKIAWRSDLVKSQDVQLHHGNAGIPRIGEDESRVERRDKVLQV